MSPVTAKSGSRWSNGIAGSSAIAALALALGPVSTAWAVDATPQLIRSATPAIGLFRKATSAFWIDVNADRQPDLTYTYGQPGDVALLGDITGSGTRVPVIFRNGQWFFDFNRDGGAEVILTFGQAGDVPLIADMDGDGKDDLVVYRNGSWLVSTTGDGALSYTLSYGGPRSTDILWRNTSTGDLGAWYTGPSGATWVSLGPSPTTWTVAQTGDFNGDGRADILWRETATGNLGINYVSGASLQFVPVGASPAGHQIAGVGDFDGDGRDDILWRNTSTGDLLIWLMNGGTWTAASVGPASLSWQIQGIGDFNGDGRADILFRESSTGQVAVWFMNRAVATSGVVSTPSLGWQVEGIGDLNGDGRADVLWRETATGNLGIWLMNGTSFTWTPLPGAPTSWKVRAIRDYNADGNADIVWRETTTGYFAVWYMSGTSVIGSYFSMPSAQWDIAGVGDMGPSMTAIPLLGDLDGDGIVDLILYDKGKWYVSANRTKLVAATHTHGGAAGDVPIVLDWDGDSVDDLAVVNGPNWNIKSPRAGGFVGTYNLGVGVTGDTPLYWGNGYVPNARLDAARFLAHATFGPTEQEIANVLNWGYAAWIDQQLAIPPSQFRTMGWWPQNAPQPPTGTIWPTCTSAFYFSGARYDPASPCNCNVGAGTDQCNRDLYSTFDLQRQFFVNALSAPDQLRQRVAWALSQIIVTSGQQDPIMYPMRDFQQMLVDNAFGRYEDILLKVTLSPWMGNYLDMVNNSRSLTATQVPNENYAREIMQLFSMGLWQLNPDGTQVLDGSSNPIPTYTQTDITELARALTGWTYNPIPPATAAWNRPVNYIGDMIPIEGALNGTGTTNYHDTNPKTVLGVTQPSGTRAMADVQWAVQLVARHASTAPFMSKQLIQHLVTSNPSPAYVGRISTVWTNTGGMLGPVVRAILTDPEALAPENPVGSSVGKLREPVLAVTSFMRQMGAQSDGVALRAANATQAMGQMVYNSPTVFNYYDATYAIPGTGLAGPPFNIFDATLYFARTNFFYNVTLGLTTTGTGTNCDAGLNRCGPNADATVLNSIGTKIDYAPLKAYAQDPVALVNAVDNLLLFGTMPKAQKIAIVNAVASIALSVPATQQQLLDRARTAVYLVATSPKFQVEH